MGYQHSRKVPTHPIIHEPYQHTLLIPLPDGILTWPQGSRPTHPINIPYDKSCNILYHKYILPIHLLNLLSDVIIDTAIPVIIRRAEQAIDVVAAIHTLGFALMDLRPFHFGLGDPPRPNRYISPPRSNKYIITLLTAH